ncbi:phosphoribosylglycinamide formyltransferase [Mariniblastus sp.]|nr:phosphoribosylglycinamide formyltransferase [Mariniblastus sp.]
MLDSQFKISVLISGGGTTLRNLIDRQKSGLLDATIAQVISNKADAGGLAFATSAGIETAIVNHRDFNSVASFSDAMFTEIRKASPDLVVMGGFLRRVLIPNDFQNRVINIHPSLIPAFCGKGMYGSNVHTAVVEYGCKLSGCTVHFVDDDYDHGPIIAQAAVPVLPDDSPKDVAARVFEKECELLPQTINLLASGNVKMTGRVVRVNQP